MTFGQPDIVILGHHPFGARTRYIFLTIVALPLFVLAPGDTSFSRVWRRDFASLRGLP